MAEKLGSLSSSSNKRMKIIGIDRLSELPDCLLISILGLLSTREAMRTCVLSRRWRFLWTDLPALAFQDESYEDEKISKFVAGVHKYLAHCGGNHLQRFEVSFNYKECFAFDVNAWVQFALRHKVKDLAFLLHHWQRESRYLLPQMVYSNSYLRCLRLKKCIMAPINTIEWGALSSLYLERVEFHGNAIEMILAGCPVLYDLYLKYCSGLNCLNVKSLSLRELTLIDQFDDDDFLEISAPFIQYVKISVYAAGRKLRLSNISSLVEADIDFQGYTLDCMSELAGYVKELFQNLHLVKELKLGPEFMQALSHMVVYEHVRVSESGLECLKVNAEVDEYSFPAIVCLLESSPNLKTLHISLSYGFRKGKLKKRILKHDLLHLKTVTIRVYQGSNLAAHLMLKLVQLLLKRAPALEKMVIEFTLYSTEYSPADYMEIAETLLSYPRASTKAAVVLAPVKF